MTQEFTCIHQNEEMKLQLNGYVNKKEAISLARENGLVGKIEIHHLMYMRNGATVRMAIIYVNSHDLVDGVVFPDKITSCFDHYRIPSNKLL